MIHLESGTLRGQAPYPKKSRQKFCARIVSFRIACMVALELYRPFLYFRWI
jgi:hypothetical protein